ncbi:MAG TPA: hypothetical protein VIL36_17140 [Acidimicrobiales bacterium]
MSAPPAPAVPETTRWERSSEVLWRRTATGVAVLPHDSTTVTALEGLQSALWLALVRPMTVDTLVDQLAEHLDDDPAVRHRVVGDAILTLVAEGALRESVEQ